MYLVPEGLYGILTQSVSTQEAQELAKINKQAEEERLSSISGDGNGPPPPVIMADEALNPPRDPPNFTNDVLAKEEQYDSNSSLPPPDKGTETVDLKKSSAQTQTPVVSQIDQGTQSESRQKVSQGTQGKVYNQVSQEAQTGRSGPGKGGVFLLTCTK